jgi:hypothetical protein
MRNDRPATSLPQQRAPSTAGMRLFLAGTLVLLFILHLALLFNLYDFFKNII